MQLNPVDFNSVTASKSKSVAGIARELGGEKGELYVRALITEGLIDLAEFFNVQNSLSERQIVTTVLLIREKFYMLKPDDLKLCFKWAMMGRFGKLYNRLDGAIIIEWLDRYLEERFAHYDEMNFKQHSMITRDIERERDVQASDVRRDAEEFSRIKADHLKESIKNDPERNSSRD